VNAVVVIRRSITLASRLPRSALRHASDWTRVREVPPTLPDSGDAHKRRLLHPDGATGTILLFLLFLLDGEGRGIGDPAADRN
jgi:hypothetical protein